MSLPEDFKRNWNQKAYCRPEDHILLAVSGGVDSMVMASLFLEAGIPFGVVHCNYGLRGQESDLDEQLVLDWCLEKKIVCYAKLFATKKIAEAEKKSIQEAARDIRYQYFEEVRSGNGFAKIATAHHLSDNAETIIMRLLKGTGIAGLTGIPETNGHIIRPLLFARKKAILAYAANRQVPFRDDKSNAGDVYLRNRIRHHIMPAIEKEFPEAVAHLNQLAQRSSDIRVIYQRALEKDLSRLAEQRGKDVYIPVRLISKKAEKQTLLYELGSRYGFTAAQLPDMMHLLEAESGKKVSSPSHHLLRNREFLIITSRESIETELIQVELIPGTIETFNASFHFSFTDKLDVIPADSNIAFIDRDMLREPLILRHWKTADYFYPLGMNNKKKKLSRFFIDQKIPLHEKEKVWLLESNKRIAWIAGYRSDERFKIKPGTKEVLRVEIIPKP